MSDESPTAGEVWRWDNEPESRLTIVDADEWDVTYRYRPDGREYSLGRVAFLSTARKVDDRT
jgi:hypothetical protein